MPKVSVLMPIYKTAPSFLIEAIDSILSQTHTDFEFLILDDCPDDDRESIVKSFKDKRIKYFKNEKNLGIAQSRNKLINMAQGEYLAIFDHDDISLPKRLEKQVAYLDNHLEVGVVGSYFINSHNHKLHKNPENSEKIEKKLLEKCVISHSSVMMRKSVLFHNHIQYESEFSPAEDYALWGRLIGKTKFYNIPEGLLIYRRHLAQTSKQQAEKMKVQTDRILKFARENNPELWKRTYSEEYYTLYLRLFGIIPLYKFTQKGKFPNKILKCLPFITIKTKMEIEK